MILPIYIYGQPVLRKTAVDIDKDYEGLDTLLENMFETLTDSDGVGLAAPQIGKDIRVVVIDLDVLSDDLPEYKGLRRHLSMPTSSNMMTTLRRSRWRRVVSPCQAFTRA